MSKPLDIDSSLPHGDQLRVLLNSDHISYGEIAHALKTKGIFSAHSDKSVTVPILTTVGLTPDEFHSLVEASVTRESVQKSKVLKLTLSAIDADWVAGLKTVPSLANVDLTSLPGVEFESEPNLKINADDSATIGYKIIRKDYSKDWLERELVFEGQIHIRQAYGQVNLEISNSHTSKETDRINSLLLRNVCKSLHHNGLVVDEEPDRILFDTFTNPDRVLFLMKLTKGIGDRALPGTILDVEIKRNEARPVLPNDPQIKWMENKVKGLKIDGAHLNDLFLLEKEEYYDYCFITRIVVEFEFEYAQNKGKCLVAFYFNKSGKSSPGYEDAEFVFSVERVSHKGKTNSDSSRKIRRQIENSIKSLVDESHNAIFMSKRAA